MSAISLSAQPSGSRAPARTAARFNFALRAQRVGNEFLLVAVRANAGEDELLVVVQGARALENEHAPIRDRGATKRRGGMAEQIAVVQQRRERNLVVGVQAAAAQT